MCSKTCLPWQGRVYINDAFTDWSGDTRYEDGVKYGRSQYCGKWFPLLSSAIAEGLFHPNCRHGIGLYIDGVTDLPEPMDNSDIERRYKEEQHQRALEREVRKAKRKVEGSLDPDDVKKAKADLREAQKELEDFIDKVNADEGTTVLKRDEGKEKVYEGEVVHNSSLDNSVESGIIKENIEIGRSLGAASKNYPIKLPTGNHGKILEGTEITDVVTFAGKGTKNPIRVAKTLEKLYDIPADEWEKVRVTAYIRAGNVNKKAELHWYEARGVRVEMKVKKYYDED